MRFVTVPFRPLLLLLAALMVAAACVPEARAQVVIKERVELRDDTARLVFGPAEGAALPAAQALPSSAIIAPKDGALKLFYVGAERLNTPLPDSAHVIILRNGDTLAVDYVRPHLSDELRNFRQVFTCVGTFRYVESYLYSSATTEEALVGIARVEKGDTLTFGYTTDSGTYGGIVEPVPDTTLTAWSAELGQYNLCLRTWSERVRFAIAIVDVVEILDAVRDTTNVVQIARWDSAYTAAGTVRNSAGDHFIDRDAERFYVRVTDPNRNSSPGVKETIRAKISTEGPGNGDDPTEIELKETGMDTGVFLSEAQLMMSPDLPLPANPDDDFAAHDGKSGPVPDDALNDRTHRAHIGATLKVEYQSSDGLFTEEANVCHPDSIRTIDVKVVVFNEPFRDTGYVTAAADTVGAGNGVFDFADVNGNGRHDAGEPSEEYRDLSVYTPTYVRRGKRIALINIPNFYPGDDPVSANGDGRGPVASETYVQKQIRRSSVAWAQACIRVEQVGSTRYEDAPTDRQGKSVLKDGKLELIRGARIVYNAYQARMMTDVAHVFFAGPLAVLAGKIAANAIAYSPDVQLFSHGAHSFTLVAPNLDPAYRTLAHELGHLLSNRGDAPNPKPIFFPADYTHKDVSVNSYRRITLRTKNASRTVRPAGNLNAVGNRLLHN